MKDYTVSHPCGLEESFDNVFEAKKFARDHSKECKIDASVPNQQIVIDEYDDEGGDMGGGELTGKYWNFDGKKFIEK